MRVAMVSPYSLERPGGVQGQVRGLARALERKGHHCAVLAPGAPRASGGGDGVLGMGRAVAVPANGSVAPVTLSPLAPRRVAATLRRLDIEVAHLHEPFAPTMGYRVLRHHDVAVVGTFHRAGVGLGYRLGAPAVRRLARGLDVACAVSAPAASTVEQMSGLSPVLLFNGIELERFATPSGQPPDGVVKVLFLGRHEPRKGLLVLLEALERLGPEGPPFEVWVASKGPMTAELRRRFPPSPRRQWLGELSDAEVAERLVAADLLCAPSLGGESFGMVLLEALAARTAVVASDIAGYRAASGGHALLVPPGDRGAWAEAMREAVAQAATGTGSSSPKAKEAGWRHAAAWSMDELASRYVELYEQALDTRRS